MKAHAQAPCQPAPIGVGMRRVILCGVLALSLCALAAPAARGQEPGEPLPVAQPEVAVHQVLVPATREKLVSRGVTVQASCRPDCLLMLEVRVPKGVARKLGLRNRVIETAIAPATSDVPVFLRGPIKRSAREPLLDFQGTARLQVRVTALP
jgi:hypothetical protein